jgi:hypothetical protein
METRSQIAPWRDPERPDLGFLLDAHQVPVINSDHDQEARNLP